MLSDHKISFLIHVGLINGVFAALEGAVHSAFPVFQLHQLIACHLGAMWGIAMYIFLDSYVTDIMRPRYGSVAYFMFHFVMMFFAGPLAFCPLFTLISIYWYYN